MKEKDQEGCQFIGEAIDQVKVVSTCFGESGKSIVGYV